MIILPVTAAPDRKFRILLGENLLTIRTYFNSVAPGWFMDLIGADGQPLALGLALVPIVNVLEAETELTRTLGQFRVFPTDGTENISPNTIAPVWWFAPGEFEAAELSQMADVILPFDLTLTYTVDPKGQPKRLRLDGSWTLDGTFILDGLDPRP